MADFLFEKRNDKNTGPGHVVVVESSKCRRREPLGGTGFERLPWTYAAMRTDPSGTYPERVSPPGSVMESRVAWAGRTADPQAGTLIARR